MAIVARARPEIRSLEPYKSARTSASRQGILLNANENPYPAPGAKVPLNRYPSPQPAELVSTLAETYRVDSNQLLITRGSDEALDLITRAFCQPYRDSILYCPPTFGMYRISAQTQGAGIVEIPLLADAAFGLDVGAIGRALESDGLRVIFLCSPNNPTGNCMPAEAVLEVVREATDRALVVVDEAYLEFAGRPSLAERIRDFDNLAVLRTLSKAYALAGARCGSLIARPAVIDLLRRILPPYPLPTPTVDAAMDALDPARGTEVQAQIREILVERDRLVERLAHLKFVRACYPSDANFVLVRVSDADALLNAAGDAGFVLRDMQSQPGLDNCLRISVGTDLEMEKFYRFLENFDRSAGA